MLKQLDIAFFRHVESFRVLSKRLPTPSPRFLHRLPLTLACLVKINFVCREDTYRFLIIMNALCVRDLNNPIQS